MRCACCGIAVFLCRGRRGATTRSSSRTATGLTGKVTSLAGGKLVLETTHSGPVEDRLVPGVSVKTDNPIKVRLVTSETFEGKLVAGARRAAEDRDPGRRGAGRGRLPRSCSSTSRPTQWHGRLTASAKATDGNTHVSRS
jgi:hypothetical protein